MSSRELANQEQGSTKMKKSLDSWKYPKIPVDQIYKKKAIRIFPSYTIKDFEQTITLKSTNQDVSIQLLSKAYLKGVLKKQHKFLHLGLVQISIKPLIRNGLGAPIIVCVRDARHRDFENSLLAMVESNLSEGPFYFNCFPSFSVSSDDMSTLRALTVNLVTGGIPLALTYRIVCKGMVDLSSEALQELTVGETSYCQANSGSDSKITKWDDVQVPESWIRRDQDPTDQAASVAKRSNSLQAQTVTLPDGRVLMRFPSARDASD